MNGRIRPGYIDGAFERKLTLSILYSRVHGIEKKIYQKAAVVPVLYIYTMSRNALKIRSIWAQFRENHRLLREHALNRYEHCNLE